MLPRYLLAWGCVALIAAAAVTTASMAVPYTPDKIVPLPVPPNPDYTNFDSGTITPPPWPNEYIVEIENELRFDRWKEWMIFYTFTPIGPNPIIDVHIDYSFKVSDDPLLFDDLGLWQTYYGPIPVNGTWTVAGFPAGIAPPLKADPQQADAVIIVPFDYNPGWVSLRFAGQDVLIDYRFYDWCIPEPGTLLMLLLVAMLSPRRCWARY